MTISRLEILTRLRNQVAQGKAIVGAGAGTGLSAKSAEAGGVDLIIIYNSGRYRMAGRGSLAGLMPYGDANLIVVDMASEVLPVVKDTPVLAGVCGTDPFRLIDVFLKELQDIGFAGVQNFPTVGLIDGLFRTNLEETGMGYDLEVEMIRKAHELDLLTAPYVFTVEEAEKMAQAGADILVAHMGPIAVVAHGLDQCYPKEHRELMQAIIETGVVMSEYPPDTMPRLEYFPERNALTGLCRGGPIVGGDRCLTPTYQLITYQLITYQLIV